MSSKKPSGKKSSRKKTPAPARFAVGDLVRVKPGTTVPGFEDVPLGGWSGTISEADTRSAPPTYLVVWDSHTLANMHPVFRKRCERDDLEIESMCLGEDDLVPHDGSPTVLEQPTAIRLRPLNPKDQDDRVRAALGMTGDDPLPGVSEETLLTFHAYLTKHLTFPFAAKVSAETGFLHQRSSAVTVMALLDTDDLEEEYGLLCAAREGKERLEVPLADVEAKKGGPARQLVEDYAYWFWNWR